MLQNVSAHDFLRVCFVWMHLSQASISGTPRNKPINLPMNAPSHTDTHMCFSLASSQSLMERFNTCSWSWIKPSWMSLSMVSQFSQNCWPQFSSYLATSNWLITMAKLKPTKRFDQQEQLSLKVFNKATLSLKIYCSPLDKMDKRFN